MSRGINIFRRIATKSRSHKENLLNTFKIPKFDRVQGDDKLSSINSLGWNDFFEEHFRQCKLQGFEVGRVAIENKTNYLINTNYGEAIGEVSGKLLFISESQSDLPKVGDWVVISLFDDNTKAVIHEVLPRQTKISRKSADRKTEEQVIAANINKVFIVQSLDDNFNINRLARYIVTVNQSGAEPVVVLNKSDLCGNIPDKISEVKKFDEDIHVIAVSAIDNFGIEKLKELIHKEETIAFVGSSGVGKSTLINVLLGTGKLRTNSIREFGSKGKHTTTRRELVVLPDGGILIDTPGMRELSLWNANDGLNQTFSEFDELAAQCRFSDCTHTHETKCAVLQALKDGIITQQQYDNYLKLRKELKYLERRHDKLAQIEEKRKWKEIMKEMKNFNKKNNQ